MSNPMPTNPICSFKFSRKFTSLFWFSSFSSFPLSKTISFLSFPHQLLGVFGVQKGGWEWAGWTGSPLGLGVRAWETGDSHSLRARGRGSIYTQQAGKNSSNPLCLALKQNRGLKYVCKVYYIFDREFLYRAKVPAPEIWGVKWSSGSANQLAKHPDDSLSKARLPRLTPEAFPALTF